MNQLPLVYIAGPISLPDPVCNTHNATVFADKLYAAGVCVPFIPHLGLTWHLIIPHDWDFWLEYDFHIIDRCDALFRLPGESKGAEAEIAYAHKKKIPVFFEESELVAWCAQYRSSASRYQLEDDKRRLFGEWQMSLGTPDAENAWHRYIVALDALSQFLATDG